jgi:predicted acyltransferase (DUF342 family)
MIGSVALLLASTGLLLALPLVPAFIELYLRRDTKPMPIKNRTEMVSDFAFDFRGQLEDGIPAVGNAPAGANARVLETDWVVDQGTSILDPIYAKGRLTAGGNNVFATIFCEKDVDLGENTEVKSWVHAQGVVTVPPGSTVHGRLSAGAQVKLETGCSFEHIHAPVVTIAGGADPRDAEHVAAAIGQPAFVPQIGPFLVAKRTSRWNPEPINIVERITERVRVPGDFVLQPGEVIRKNVVAGRRVHLSEGSHVVGNVKSNHGMELDPGVRAEGSLFSASNLRIGAGCVVRGPVVAEGELLIESGARIGSWKYPTTVRAKRIQIAPAVTLHGSMWACERGQVTA